MKGIRVEPNGDYLRAVWYDDKGRRQRKNIGKASELRKKDVRNLIDELAAKHTLNPKSRERGKCPTLKEWTDAYTERQAGKVSAGQLKNDAKTIAYLVEYGDFGEGIRLDRMTPAAADDWAHWLGGDKGKSLSSITVAGHVRRARTMFRRAVKRGECPSNPFEGVTVAVEPVAHETWVDASMIDPLLSACPGAAWRALMALCIYTGCRRSEAIALEWSAIRWGETKLVVPNIKTRRSTGASTRTVRMEPELERVLLDCREVAEGTAVVPSYRRRVDGDAGRGICLDNIDRDIHVIYKRAGIDCLGDPFKVWRRWRSDEWERLGFPRAVVRQWIGNSEAVAQKHYDGVAPQFYGDRSPLEALAAAEAKIRGLEERSKHPS